MSEEEPKPKQRRLGFLAGLILGVAVGSAVVALAVNLVDVKSEPSGNLVEQAQQVIEESYWREVAPEELERASVEGMIDDLREEFDDRFSYYFDPDDYASFQQSAAGSFSGVGLSVTEVDEGLRVVALLPDSPAIRAGIAEGDLIVEVDGTSLEGMDSEEATQLIKGPAGSEVELVVVTPAEISQSGEDEEQTLVVERADVRVPAVYGEMMRTENGTQVGYIAYGTFSRESAAELRAEAERLFARGAEGLVIDMRSNGGGLFQESVLASKVFVDEGVLVTTSARSRGERTYDADGTALDPRPIVILTNNDTASASEIFAAALADNDVAVIVGTETFGKGVFQEVIGLPAGGALDLTVGEFFTPNGVSLAGDGIDPDIEIEDDPATQDRDEALDRGLRELSSLISSGSQGG